MVSRPPDAPARRRALAWAVALAALASCEEIPVSTTNLPPAGVLRGTVVYQGPAPCTRDGRVVGGALLVVASVDAPPPPAGLVVAPAQFGSVPGESLFRGIADGLPRGGPGELVCPAPDAAPIIASVPWQLGPLPGGRYQIQSFYDRDGDFSPLLSYRSQPSDGDIGGGAIENLAAVLAAGATPVFQTFTVGEAARDGSFRVPDEGVLVDNVTVSLGLPIASPRPVFHANAVLDERPAAGPVTPALNADLARVALATDERLAALPLADPLNAEKLFVRLSLGPSFAEAERPVAEGNPYFLRTGPPADQFYLSASPDAQGAPLPIPEAAAVAALFPQAFFTKIDERGGPAGLLTQASPVVALPGITLRGGSFAQTLAASFVGEDGRLLPPQPSPDLTLALRPAALCLSATDPGAPAYLVTPSFRTLSGDTLIDPALVAPALRALLGRPDADVRVVEGCLPRGSYQINLFYPSGQSWTTPNELGSCIAPEVTQRSGSCRETGFRARTPLASQTMIIQIGDEAEPGYCAALHPDDADFAGGIPRACLRPDEIRARRNLRRAGRAPRRRRSRRARGPSLRRLGAPHAARGPAPRLPAMSCAARSPIMMAEACVWPRWMRGMIDTSATRSPSTPRTRSSGSTTDDASAPMRQVPTGWYRVSARSRANAASESSSSRAWSGQTGAPT
jgi:hypothetical protein